MNAQALRSGAMIPEATGETSRRLWSLLNQDLQATTPPARRSANVPDHLALSLMGRCLLADGIHVVCETAAVTARGLKINCEALADPGDFVVTNFRGLGEISGRVESRGDSWFVLDLAEQPERLATLSKRILWHMRLQADAATDRRMSVRFDQKQIKIVLKTIDGRECRGELLDLSATGAAVRLGAAAPYFWIGQPLMIDDRSGRVRRHFAGGVGVEFDEAREVVGGGDPLELVASA